MIDGVGLALGVGVSVGVGLGEGVGGAEAPPPPPPTPPPPPDAALIVKVLMTLVAARYLEDSAEFAVKVQVPAPVSVTINPEIVHDPSANTTTGIEEEDVAFIVTVPGIVCEGIVAKLIDCATFTT